MPFPDGTSWTRQPGPHGDFLHVSVIGVGPSVDRPASVPQRIEPQTAQPVCRFPLHNFQNEAVLACEKMYIEKSSRAPLVVLPTGCHRAGQHLLMYDGSTKAVEDVVSGDMLMGPDSSPRTVLSLCRGHGHMVTIKPVKGDPWTVNEDHILTIVLTPDSDSPASVHDIAIRDYEHETKTFRHRAKLFRPAVVHFPPLNSPPLDPYFLGLYLADGTLAVPQVAVSKPDAEVRQECERQASLYGMSVRQTISPRGGCPTWHIRVRRGSGRNPILDILRNLNLMPCASEARFVPDCYRLGSVTTRSSCLAGILDGDGHLSGGGYDFISKSHRLATDVTFLARSLGYAAFMSACIKHCQNSFTGSYWRVSISGDLSRLPMRIPRKKAAPRQQKKNHLRTGFAAERTGTVEPYFGFTLDGDGRYLLGDFTVTHNTGKTLVASALMQRSMSWTFRPYKDARQSGALFITHRRELIKQTVEKVRLVAEELRVGVVQGERNELGCHVTVASISTLSAGRRLEGIIDAGPYHLIVIDEAHHAVAKTWRKVLDRLRAAFPEAFLFGMTATPGRADGTALDLVFDSVAYEKSLEWAVNHGYLVPPRGKVIPLKVDLDKVESQNGDFVTAKLSKVMNTEPVNKAVVRGWQEYGNDAKMLAFCVDVAHSYALAQMFCDEGYPAIAVDGKTKPAAREKALADFRSGAIRILASADLFSEGYDDPSAEGILLARPTLSQGLLIQQIGRGLRRFPLKTECLVLDCVGNTSRHQLAQLATIAGLDPEKKIAASSSGQVPPWMLPPQEPDPVVNDATVGPARDVQLIGALSATKYQWRQTTAGFALRIPRVGYYLVVPDDDLPTKAHVRFFDRRKDREHGTPRHVMGPIEMEMAYTLVEADLDRLRRATNDSYWTKDRGGPQDGEAVPLPTGLIDFGDGVDFVPDEWLLKEQSWHDQPATPKQIELLRKLGVKMKSMPDTSGEASELIDVLQIEKDIRNSQPATGPQKWYIRQNRLPLPRGTSIETVTRSQASRMIVSHKIQAHKKPKPTDMAMEGEQLSMPDMEEPS